MIIAGVLVGLWRRGWRRKVNDGGGWEKGGVREKEG
jgi:hypothetical protein